MHLVLSTSLRFSLVKERTGEGQSFIVYCGLE